MDIGVVTGVVGRTTYHVTFYGESSHAATTTRENRRDALHASARYIVQLHELIDEYPEGIVNCGDVRVKPGAFNVIPSEAVLRVECRHPDETTLHEMEQRLIQLAEDIAAQHQLRVECREVLHRPAVTMAEPLLQIIDEVCDEAACKHQRMVSLAGHDAQILSPFTPAAMIFIPSVEGYSHNPREFTEWHHIELGANILLQTVLKLAYQV
jgi:hydantoinase/carbamoylase family amidase